MITTQLIGFDKMWWIMTILLWPILMDYIKKLGMDGRRKTGGQRLTVWDHVMLKSARHITHCHITWKCQSIDTPCRVLAVTSLICIFHIGIHHNRSLYRKIIYCKKQRHSVKNKTWKVVLKHLHLLNPPGLVGKGLRGAEVDSLFYEDYWGSQRSTWKKYS